MAGRRPGVPLRWRTRQDSGPTVGFLAANRSEPQGVSLARTAIW